MQARSASTARRYRVPSTPSNDHRGARPGSLPQGRESIDPHLRLGRSPRYAELSDLRPAWLLRALREAMPWHADWVQMVPQLQALQAGRLGPPSEDDIEVLRRLLRLMLLAEFVFGDKDLAREWLSTPKVHLRSDPPLSRVGTARGTVQVERWLLNIEEGNGP